MARRISELRTVNKAANTSREYLLLSNIDSNSSTKIGLNDVLPTLQSGKTAGSVTKGTAGTTVQDLFVGGGVGSSVANTDKSILIFKGLNVDDTNGALKIRTDKSTADGTKQNIVIELDQTSINLNVADNTASEFLSETGGKNPLVLGTSNISGTLPVANGGTGRTTLTDGALLVGNGTTGIDSIGTMALGALVVGAGAGTNPSVITVGTDNQVLIADSAQANGVKWGDPIFKSTSFSGTVETNNNDIKLGTGIIRGSSNNSGIALNTTTDHVFIGGSSRYYTGFLNVGGSIYVGTSTGDTAQKVQANDCSSGASPTFTIQGSDNSDSTTGGDLILIGGSGDGDGSGGTTILAGGRKAGTGTEGSVKLQQSGSDRLVLDNTYNEFKNRATILPAVKGLMSRGDHEITQTTSLTTGVTLNSYTGKITLFATAIAAASEYVFTLTNSVIGADSMIMLTVEDGGSGENNGATLCATVSGLSAGSAVIRLTNPGSADTGTTNKIHFFVVNAISS